MHRSRRHSTLTFWLLALLVFALTSPVQAQRSTGQPAPKTDTRLQDELSAIEQQLARALHELDEQLSERLRRARAAAHKAGRAGIPTGERRAMVLESRRARAKVYRACADQRRAAVQRALRRSRRA